MSLRDYPKSYYLLCVVAFLSMFSIMIINPLLSIYAMDIGATGVMIGWAVSGYWISRVILEIPSGYISSKFGYYKPMAFGLILTVLGNVLMLFVRDPLFLVIIRAINGFGAPFFFAVSMTFIVNLVEADKRGQAMGIFQGIEFIGQIIGSTFSGKIVDSLGWRGGFLTALALSLVALIIFIVPPYIRRETVQGPTAKPLQIGDVLGVLKNKTLLVIAAVTLAEFIMTSGLINTVLSVYANDTLGFSLPEVGYMMGARSIGFVIAMFTMGTFADKIGRKPVLLFGLIGTSILVIVMSGFTTLLTISSVIAVIGFTSGAIWIVGPVVSAEAVSQEQRGAAIGVYRTFFDGGSLLGPIIMAAVMTDYGVNLCFYLSAALMLITVPFVLMIKETGGVKGEVIAH
jgi:MFS family permease